MGAAIGILVVLALLLFTPAAPIEVVSGGGGSLGLKGEWTLPSGVTSAYGGPQTATATYGVYLSTGLDVPTPVFSTSWESLTGTLTSTDAVFNQNNSAGREPSANNQGLYWHVTSYLPTLDAGDAVDPSTVCVYAGGASYGFSEWCLAKDAAGELLAGQRLSRWSLSPEVEYTLAGKLRVYGN